MMITSTMQLDEKAIKTISEILARGNSAEIRKRKNEIVVMEIQGKIKHRIAADGQ